MNVHGNVLCKQHTRVCVKFILRYLIFTQKIYLHKLFIGGSWGDAPAHAPPPTQDQILWFLHKFLVKSTCVKGPHTPPNGSMPPSPTGNPGSATAIVKYSQTRVTRFFKCGQISSGKANFQQNFT